MRRPCHVVALARALRALLAAGVLLVAGCAPQRLLAPRLTSQPVAVPPAATPAPAPDAGLALIVQAVRVIEELHVDRPAFPPLLQAAWGGVQDALPPGVAVQPPDLGSAGDDDTAATQFSTAYLDAAAQAGRVAGAGIQQRLVVGAIRRVAESLRDCHTYYADPRQASDQAQRLEGQVRFGGVGIRIQRTPPDPAIVWETIAGGSAARAGVRPGDAVLKVDGRDVTGMEIQDIANLIRGPERTSVRLTLERYDRRRIQEVTLKRVLVSDTPVRSRLLPSRIGYVRIDSFSPASETATLNALRTFEAQDAVGWVLDLRANGGGTVDVLLSLLSKFVNDGPFGYQVGRDGARAAIGPDGSYLPKHHPLAVLVGENTASAAELFASTVQRYGAGVLVGTRTAGCVGAGQLFALPDGSLLSVTVQKLLGATGEEINGVGVTPREQVSLSRSDLAAGRDPQLDRAVVLLQRS